MLTRPTRATRAVITLLWAGSLALVGLAVIGMITAANSGHGDRVLGWILLLTTAVTLCAFGGFQRMMSRRNEQARTQTTATDRSPCSPPDHDAT
jgi:thiol:disulfide interchange protein